ncbi:hypothetical protein Acor_31340 [Acrocarpospora corrugata]|uniref:DUF937 domain-containing protein n=2 Tax=Acrocarpospora corrugata TaxID=35763 RepID=A0A5M3VYQ0_9ACTN|nr:hypothetical protein Acor_31340 [Acrocarpospora corrugata]
MQDDLFAKLGPQGIQQIAGLIGTDTESAKGAVQASLGTIMGGMAHQAENMEGAQSLRSAVDQHTDSDPFTNVTGLADDNDGRKILSHVLGDQGTDRAAQGISQFMGINSRTVSKVLTMVAPMVMAMLAKRLRQGMEPETMSKDLDRERQDMGSGLGDLLGGLLGAIFGDQDEERRQPDRSESGAIPMPGAPRQPRPQPPPRRSSNPDW